MDKIALFPLNTVLFPGVPIQLHIFELRYRKMVADCRETGMPFGVILIRRGEEAHGPLAEPVKVGCTARITEVSPLGDGRMNLSAVGQSRFRVLGLSDDQPYLMGEVELWPLRRPGSSEFEDGARLAGRHVRRYLGLLSRPDSETGLDPDQLLLPSDPILMLYLAAALLQVPALEKQPLLEAADGEDLLRKLARLYRREIALLEQEQRSGAKPERPVGGLN
jgi:Lon protease-like protein